MGRKRRFDTTVDLRNGEVLLGWESIGAYGQEALFRRFYEGHWGRGKVRFIKVSSTRFPRIYAVLKRQ